MIPYKLNYAYLRRGGTPAPGVLDGTSWKLSKNKSWSAFGTTVKNYFMNFTFYTDTLQTTPADTVFTDLFINGDVSVGQISRTTQYGIACLSDSAYDVNATGTHATKITEGSREWTIGKYGFGYNKNMDRYITFINGEDSNNEELIGWLETYCTYLGPVKYDVSYDATNCELDGPSEIKEDEEITVYITPDEGYIIDDVSVTGANYTYVEGSNEISIYDPTDDVAVEVICKSASGDTWHITYVAQNCTISGPEEVEDGDDFWVDGSADDGYHFEFEPEIDGDYDDMGGSMVDCDSIRVYGCHSDLTITAVASPD